MILLTILGSLASVALSIQLRQYNINQNCIVESRMEENNNRITSLKPWIQYVPIIGIIHEILISHTTKPFINWFEEENDL